MTKFHDRRAIQLSSLKPGEIAISAAALSGLKEDRVFTCVYVPTGGGSNAKQIIELSNLTNQYLEKVNLQALVVRLEPGQTIEIGP